MLTERKPSVETQPMPTSEGLRKTAQQLVEYSLEVQPKDVLLIKVSPACGALANEVIAVIKEKNEKLLDEDKIHYRLQIISPDIDKTVLEGVSQGKFRSPLSVEETLGSGLSTKDLKQEKTMDDRAAFLHYGQGSDELQFLLESNKVLVIRERREITEKYDIDKEIEQIEATMGRNLTNIRVNERRWCLIVPPTENSVRPEGMSFEEYLEFYYRASSRDWEKVETAQAKLIEKLRTKKKLRIVAPSVEGKDPSWSTDIEMDIEGKIFANSGAKRNVPGSEVFSSPNISYDNGEKRGTVNGIFAIPYPVFFKERIIPDLRLELKGGKVVNWYCSGSDEDKAFIEKILTMDEGASWIGEIGIGTNPLVDIPVPDTLIAEKSFGVHLAIGKAYDYTDYMGTPVKVDNGNRSLIHIDLPLIMKYAGQIIADDEIIFDGTKGGFIDPELAYLNGEAA